MPLYKLKCSKCGREEDYFVGKVLSAGELEQKKCRGCGEKMLTKVPTPINSAKFSEGSSRRSLKTKTGVGEIQFKPGAKRIIDEANQ